VGGFEDQSGVVFSAEGGGDAVNDEQAEVRREGDAGARFDAVLAEFKNAWAERHPSEPFSVNGVVTPKAMEFVEGYAAGLQAQEETPAHGVAAGG
jgi:hypothetical protein